MKRDMTDLNDTELVTLSLDGDEIAFGILVKRYEVQMYRTAIGIVKSNEVARDVTQRSFLKCWEKLDSYNANHKFFSWLYRIIVNESLNYLRKEKNHVEIPNDYSTQEGPLSYLLKSELLKSLATSINNLSDDHRIVIQLRHFEGLSYEDIADVLDIDKKTVKSRLYEARMNLRNMLSDH